MARGSTVSIDVGQLRTIPDVVGMAKDDAVAALAEIGASSFHYEYKNSSEAEDTVLAVNPAAGSTFSSSDTITLTLAQGYPAPDPIGWTVCAAVAAPMTGGLQPTSSMWRQRGWQARSIRPIRQQGLPSRQARP